MTHLSSPDVRLRRRTVCVAVASVAAFGCARQTIIPRLDETRAAQIDLVVAATTDVHGRLRSWDYYTGAPEPVRGLTRAATIVDSLRGANPGRVVLVDAGDLLQGNP